MTKASELEKIANLKGWQAALEHAWKTPQQTVDWIAMEATLRAFTKAWSDGAQVTPMDLSSILAAFTRRGPAI